MKLKEELRLRNVGDEHVIVDPGQDMVDMSKVYTLNDTAAFLWKELYGREFTEEEMIEILRENYDVSRQQAEIDTRKLINDFRVQGLLDDVQ